MSLRTKLLATALVTACTTATAQSPGDYHMYFTEAFARYGQSIEDCEALRQTRQPPADAVVSKLDQYDLQDVRVFLVYNAYKRMQNCSSDATAELLIATGSLRNKDNLLGATRQSVEALEEILFMGIDLEYEMKYRQLPEAMREDLERVDYFRTPFDAFSVIDRLE